METCFIKDRAPLDLYGPTFAIVLAILVAIHQLFSSGLFRVCRSQGPVSGSQWSLVSLWVSEASVRVSEARFWFSEAKRTFQPRFGPFCLNLGLLGRIWVRYTLWAIEWARRLLGYLGEKFYLCYMAETMWNSLSNIFE